MAIENTREVTGISSIPAYEVKTGLFTQNAVKSNVLDFHRFCGSKRPVQWESLERARNL